MSPPPPPPPPLLEDDNLLSEILLRLPPEPSSLPRASLVCNRWLHLVSDTGFFRRFRLHHRGNPDLIGFFDGFHFEPTMDPPNRVPRGRFSLRLRDDEVGDHFELLGCRHGLVLIFHISRNQLLVWDPVTGDQHRIALTPGFPMCRKGALNPLINGAVLRTASARDDHFQVVLVVADNDGKQLRRALICVYSSETGMWGNLITTPLPPRASSNVTLMAVAIDMRFPGVLVGDFLYWKLFRSEPAILEFDLGRQRLAVIPVPVNRNADGNCHFWVMRADGGGLGIICISKSSAQLWKRKIDSDGVASWVLGKTIELDKLLSTNSEIERGYLEIVGYAEENNAVFLSSVIGLFTVQLESLQFKKISEAKFWSRVIHSNVSILQARALVVRMVELNFCTIHRTIGQIDMLL